MRGGGGRWGAWARMQMRDGTGQDDARGAVYFVQGIKKGSYDSVASFLMRAICSRIFCS